MSQEDTYIATEGYAFYTDEYQISDNESLILSRQNEKLFQNSTETQIFATNGFLLADQKSILNPLPVVNNIVKDSVPFYGLVYVGDADIQSQTAFFEDENQGLLDNREQKHFVQMLSMYL